MALKLILLELHFKGLLINREMTCFTNNPKNIRQINGTLIMTATERLNSDKSIDSSRILTKEKLEYGKVEIKAAMPRGKSLFVLMALYSNINDKNKDYLYINLNRGLKILENAINFTNNVQKWMEVTEHNLNEFHLYSFEWSERQMIWKFDSQVIQTYKFESRLSEYDKLNLDISLSVGVNHFKNPNVYNISNDWVCPSLAIDYIRYYQWLGFDPNSKASDSKDMISNTVEDNICGKNSVKNWTLIWNDEFDGQDLDNDKWDVENHQYSCEGML